MFGWLVPFLGFIFVFGLVVFIHEAGHFAVARWNDVEIEAFALGMGPKLFSYQGPETEYRLCLIPLGGYVKLAGEEPGEDEENPRSFQNRPVKVRLAVLVAGAVCNVLLGFFIYVPLGMFLGEMVFPARVGFVQTGLPADGILEIGDRILEINGVETNNFQDVQTRNSLLGGQERRILIERNAEKKTVNLIPEKLEQRSLFQPEYLIGISPYLPPVISELGEESILAHAGLREGDTIFEVAGQPVKSWDHFVHLLRDANGEISVIHGDSDRRETIYLQPPSLEEARRQFLDDLALETDAEEAPVVVEVTDSARAIGLQSGDRLISIADTPLVSVSQLRGLITDVDHNSPLYVQREGEEVVLQLNLPQEARVWQDWLMTFQAQPPYETKHYSFISAWPYAASRTVEIIKLMFQGLWGLISGRLSVGSMAGPVGIVMLTGQVARVGFGQLLGFTAFLSINLGVINLLPIPVLDGGHILLSLPELFTGRALSEKTFEYANRLGLLLLFSLLILVTWVDIGRLGLIESLLELFGG